MKSLLLLLSGIFILMACSNQPNVVAVNSGSVDSAAVNINTGQNSDASLFSEITCPKCKHTKTEKLPTEVCMVSYTCENCKEVMHPKDDDCCVFCTYGTHTCPSKQDN